MQGLQITVLVVKTHPKYMKRHICGNIFMYHYFYEQVFFYNNNISLYCTYRNIPNVQIRII